MPFLFAVLALPFVGASDAVGEGKSADRAESEATAAAVPDAQLGCSRKGLVRKKN